MNLARIQIYKVRQTLRYCNQVYNNNTKIIVNDDIKNGNSDTNIQEKYLNTNNITKKNKKFEKFIYENIINLKVDKINENTRIKSKIPEINLSNDLFLEQFNLAIDATLSQTVLEALTNALDVNIFEKQSIFGADNVYCNIDNYSTEEAVNSQDFLDSSLLSLNDSFTTNRTISYTTK